MLTCDASVQLALSSSTHLEDPFKSTCTSGPSKDSLEVECSNTSEEAFEGPLVQVLLKGSSGCVDDKASWTDASHANIDTLVRSGNQTALLQQTNKQMHVSLPCSLFT